MSEYAVKQSFEDQMGANCAPSPSPTPNAPPLIQAADTISECCGRIQKAESTVLGIQASLFGEVHQAEENEKCNDTMPGQVGRLGSTVDALMSCISSLENEIARLSKQLQ